MKATTLPHTRPRTNLSVSLAALLAGAALSAGVIALADTNELASPSAKVTVLDAPPAPATAPQADEPRLAGPRGLASSLSNR